MWETRLIYIASFPHILREMTYNTHNRKRVLNGVELMPGCSRYVIARLYTHSRNVPESLERYLPKLVKEGRIYERTYNGVKVYSKSKKQLAYEAHLDHHQICGEALIRMKNAAPYVQFYSEAHLRGKRFGAVPEWAAWFPEKDDEGPKVLLFEYSTKDNLKRPKMMANKIERYEINLFKFEDYFKAKALVLFVLEAPRFEVEKFAEEHKGDQSFYCELDSFMDVGKCDQLDASIYIWGHDGGRYALTSD